MGHLNFALAVLTSSLLTTHSLAQTAVSDAQAVAVLTQAVKASGVSNPVNPIQDFTATGTITYFWAGEQVTGPATVKGRGSDQFRVDANLPSSTACIGCPGTRSYAVSHGTGALKEPDGTLKPIPLHNTINVGVLSFPYLSIAAALNDPSTIESYIGLATVDGRQVQQVRVQRNFSATQDPGGMLASLCISDYFVDAQTNLVLKTADATHPIETLTQNYAHEIELANYASTNGIQAPMLVREKVGGQTIWEIRLTGISFNTGLTDADFIVQ